MNINTWNKYPEIKPAYSDRKKGERYDSAEQRNRNSYLVKVEENKERTLHPSIFFDVLEFQHTGTFYGVYCYPEGDSSCAAKVIEWMEIPK